jgi:hypothetical protein
VKRAASLLLCVAAAAAAPPAAVPYVQVFGNGTSVNWLQGEANAVGRVRIFRDLRGNPVTYKVTQQEAEDDGYTRLLEALGEAPLDAATRLSAQPDILRRWRKLIEKTPATEVLQDRGSVFRVRIAAPLRGDNGLMSVLLPDRKPGDDEDGVTTAAAAWRPGAGLSDAAARPARQTTRATGLVIDARHLDGDDLPAPAFLPRVVDSDGRVVYGIDAIDLDFARAYGMAVYRAPSAEGTPEPPPGREGPDPVQVMAMGARGDLRADIVIEPEAADRILKAAGEDDSFLRECRVLVRMPPSPRPPAVSPPNRRRPVPPTAPPPVNPQ